MNPAPKPGNPPDLLLSPGRKDLVTTGLGDAKVWATVGQGMVQEVFWPDPGEPRIRDIGFIVTGNGWWEEVKTRASYSVTVPDPRTPLATITHTGPPEHPYQLILELVCDPQRDVLLIRYQLSGADAVFVMLASHLQHHPVSNTDSDVSGGRDNDASAKDGRLFASRGDRWLCLAARGSGFLKTSVGFYGVNDLWHDFADDGQMTWNYDSAQGGAVVLSGQLADLQGTLAVGFAGDQAAAAGIANDSLAAGFDPVRTDCAARWMAWAATTAIPAPKAADPPGLADTLRLSATVIKSHQDQGGAIVASLAGPWGDRGNSAGGQDLGLGTAYYRYNFDGYGEQLNGAGHDGANGLGRPWPLLAGERGHHAVMVGADATPQLQSMLKLRSDTGLVPEQVWNEPPLLPNPDTGVPSAPLYTGRPTLSATPLVWGHSELVKLAIARATGRPVERLASVASRYGGGVTPTPGNVYWRDAVPVTQLPRGRNLVVEASDSFTLRYGPGQGQNVTERASAALGLGMHGVTVTSAETAGWDVLEFARRFGGDFEIPHQVTLGVPLLQALPAVGRSLGAP